MYRCAHCGKTLTLKRITENPDVGVVYPNVLVGGTSEYHACECGITFKTIVKEADA